MRSLCHLFGEPRDRLTPVARRWDPQARTDRIVRWGDLCRDVGGLRERLAGEPDGPWVLLTEEAYAFAVGLLALWHSGRYAISPPNRQPGSLRGLQTRAAGVLSDRPHWFPEGSCVDPLATACPADAGGLAPLDPDAMAVELFTSGTTGAEKPVAKRIRHLADEVQELGATWEARLEGATVFATASHQHLYGLLFGVLWPLCAGRPFQAEHLLHAGELVPRIREAGSFVLASVPTHLRRLARHSEVETLRSRCRGLFSSGGPLPAETARAMTRVLGRAPVEVLGSTETGGIAWRVQEPGAAQSPWTPMPSVRLALDPRTGGARVRSPFVSVDDSGPGFATGDRITLQADGRFHLGERTDRVVKVGEKRLDLGQMESRLRAHPCVAEVALATIDRGAETRVAAAVVPTPQGWQQIRSEGRRAFARTVGASLAEGWDPVLHPRLWRAVARLPEDPQGKVTLDGLRELFQAGRAEAPADGAPVSEEPQWVLSGADRPEVLEELRGDDFVERTCLVPRDLACFPGHFPDRPVVPAVLQLDWAMELAGLVLGEPPAVEEIVSLKLRAPLQPGDRFRIRVRVSSGSRVDLRLWADACEHAVGRLRLGAAGRADA